MPNLSKTIKKTENFANLEKGWKFGKGVPISAERIQTAIEILNYGSQLGIERFNTFAGESGEVLISFYIEDQSIDLTLETNETITFAEDNDDEQIDFQKGLSLADAYQKIWEFTQKIQTTSESFTLKIMMWSLGDLRVSPLSRQVTAEYPYLKPTAGSTRVEPSVSTSKISTVNLREPRRYSGNSRTKIYPLTARLTKHQAKQEMCATETSWAGRKMLAESFSEKSR